MKRKSKQQSGPSKRIRIAPISTDDALELLLEKALPEEDQQSSRAMADRRRVRRGGRRATDSREPKFGQETPDTTAKKQATKKPRR